MGKIYSVPGLFGGEDFYDESGHKVGYSIPGVFSGRDFYDADGNLLAILWIALYPAKIFMMRMGL